MPVDTLKDKLTNLKKCGRKANQQVSLDRNTTMLTFVIKVYERWQFTMGEPTIAECLITAAFIATALLSWFYARRPIKIRGHRLFWRSIAVALLVLGINKQLDLHNLMEAIVREVAVNHGWYPQRRIIQVCFITGLATASLALVIFTGWAMRNTWRQRWLPFCGIVLLLVFIVARAASINHIYEILKIEAPGVWLRNFIALSGIACIGVSAILGMADYRRKNKKKILSQSTRN